MRLCYNRNYVEDLQLNRSTRLDSWRHTNHAAIGKGSISLLFFPYSSSWASFSLPPSFPFWVLFFPLSTPLLEGVRVLPPSGVFFRLDGNIYVFSSQGFTLGPWLVGRTNAPWVNFVRHCQSRIKLIVLHASIVCAVRSEYFFFNLELAIFHSRGKWRSGWSKSTRKRSCYGSIYTADRRICLRLPDPSHSLLGLYRPTASSW